MRFVVPVLFLAVAAWVWWTAGQDPNAAVVLPLLDRLDPSLRDDPPRWGRLSAGVLAAVGGLMLARAALRRDEG